MSNQAAANGLRRPDRSDVTMKVGPIQQQGIMSHDERSSTDREASKQGAGSSSDARRRPKPWVRLSGAGLELAFITIVFGAIGAAIDRWLQAERPLCSALVGLMGFVFGMFRFIRLAVSISDQQRALEAGALPTIKIKQESVPESDSDKEQK